jgi:hypothetical protein
MASGKKRIALEICLPDGARHRATVLPGITVGQLLREVLAEFSDDVRYLDRHQEQRYSLWLPDDDFALPPDRAIRALGPLTALELREKPLPIPNGATPLGIPFYLRYRSHVFPIGWQPALIGRPEPNSPRNNLLAVNLEPYSLAVSRQQAEILRVESRVAVRRLSGNPTSLNGELLPFNEESPDESPAFPLGTNDSLSFDHSGITLQCIVLETEPA